MKKHLILIAIVFIAVAAGCKKHHNLPKFPTPDWQVDNGNGQYPASMTAVVKLPDAIQRLTRQGDQLGAFVGDECRGAGQLVMVDSVNVFFILIQGTTSEKSKISFKYYSSRKSYMYKTEAYLPFTVDGNYGTADNPQMLEVNPVRRK